MQRFRAVDARVLDALSRLGSSIAVEVLAQQLQLDQSPIAGALTGLANAGLVELSESSEDELRLGPKGATWVSGEAPERSVARALRGLGGRCDIKGLPEKTGLDQKLVGESLRWLQSRAWGSKQGNELVLTETWSGDAEPKLQPDEQLVARLSGGGVRREDLEAESIPVAAGLALLSARAGVVDRKERVRRFARLTADGREAIARGIDSRDEVNELSTELLVSGRWREVEFRSYDISLPGPRLIAAKEHPFRRILESTRRVFLEMGFSETASPWVESGFWDFDALFQPQDHPARDMQDTFYVSRPARARLPSESLVQAVAQTHETGGNTGSLGWRYRWDRALAEQTVLRTHTTSATIQELSLDPKAPRKVFCVGPVFRRETIDYKHLPVFHQVDGIVIDEHASFAGLMTLLRTFYGKMGFDRLQFRPGFFPYTEPSVEVFVYLEARQDWVEMGGAGIFRPEVAGPLGCTAPVLAWGLGLERLAMFRYGLSDIRELYLAHLDWLEETPLCR
ncbi:MAG: phenylalanine--tRNA ligase subunit alpha [Acidobacteriota bacterium]